MNKFRTTGCCVLSSRHSRNLKSSSQPVRSPILVQSSFPTNSYKSTFQCPAVAPAPSWATTLTVKPSVSTPRRVKYTSNCRGEMRCKFGGVTCAIYGIEYGQGPVKSTQ